MIKKVTLILLLLFLIHSLSIAQTKIVHRDKHGNISGYMIVENKNKIIERNKSNNIIGYQEKQENKIIVRDKNFNIIGTKEIIVKKK